MSPSQTVSTSFHQSNIRLTVTVVRAFNLPKISSLNPRDQVGGRFYGILTIDEKQKSTKVVESNAPEWHKSFSFDTHQSSVLKLVIYARHAVRKDKHIGGFSELIMTLCLSISDGGNLDVIRNISEGTSARVELRLTIEEASPTNVIGGTKAILSKMQSPAEAASMAANVPTAALRPMKDFVDTWTPLLDKIGIFCKLAEGVAEVHPYAKMTWSIISIPQKVMKTQMDRDDRIQKLFTAMNTFYDVVSDLEKEPDKIGSLRDL